jgi:hypothetical protein
MLVQIVADCFDLLMTAVMSNEAMLVSYGDDQDKIKDLA